MLPEAFRLPRVFGETDTCSNWLGEDRRAQLEMASDLGMDTAQNIGGGQVIVPANIYDGSVAPRVRSRIVERLQPEEQAGLVQQAGGATHERSSAFRPEIPV